MSGGGMGKKAKKGALGKGKTSAAMKAAAKRKGSTSAKQKASEKTTKRKVYRQSVR